MTQLEWRWKSGGSQGLLGRGLCEIGSADGSSYTRLSATEHILETTVVSTTGMDQVTRVPGIR